MAFEQIENCKNAQLHLGDTIQDYGALVVIDNVTGAVIACSLNLEPVAGLDPAQVLGKPWMDLLSSEELHTLVAADNTLRRLNWQWTIGGRSFMAAGYSNASQTLVELVPGPDTDSFDINNRFGFLEQVAAITEAEEVAEYLMREVAAITGFERVLLYKFLPEWHGKVIAEQLQPGVQGFLHQHFPAGDIPENARRLYTINLQRYIADTESVEVGILSGQSGQELDMTHSQLRAVHPVHIEYLRNIRARSSFSVSILASGRLWGMIACHHHAPLVLRFRQRFLCEELTRIASLQISSLLSLGAERQRLGLRLVLAQVENLVKDSDEPTAVLAQQLGTVSRIFAADSVVLRVGKKRISVGPIARSGKLLVLKRWLEKQPLDRVWHRDSIPAELERYPALVNHASGMLFIPLGGERRLLLLRSEQSQNLVWAGRPPHASSDAAADLSPRTSFESWVEQTHGQARAWSTVEQEAAAQFGQNVGNYLDRLQLEKIALEDSLTGLANRRSYEQELQRLLALHDRRKVAFAVFMLDLDKFKDVNDSWGHAAGDALLVEVAQRLKSLLREDDTVARLGGDEFALIQCNIKGIPDVALVAERIVEELRRPYDLEEGCATIGVSVGVALYPEHGEAADVLLERADEALYAVKRAGRNAWRLWSGS